MRALIYSQLCLVAMLLSSAGAAFAAEPSPAQQTQVLSDGIMSPYCPGLTLSACPSDQARLLREEIQSWFVAGATEPEVKKRLERRFGDHILGLPPLQEIRWASFALPAVILLAGIFAVIFAVGRHSRVKPGQHAKAESFAAAGSIEARVRRRLLGEEQ